MTRHARCFLTIVILVAAAAWFLGLRGEVGKLLSGVPRAYRGPVFELDSLENTQTLSYSPVELRTQFGQMVGQPSAPIGVALVTQPGQSEAFWVVDEVSGGAYQITATLRYAGEKTLIYVDNHIEVDQKALEQAALNFEMDIYYPTMDLFSPEAPLGFESDSRLTILHTPLASAGGYFSQADTEPIEVNRFSNQRNMFVIGSDSYLPGDDGYLMILAHELQHMIHASLQPNSPAWFNEGMSMLAQDLNGYIDDDLALIYLANPDISLTDWAQNASETGEYYGAAQLFLRYFYQQYGGVEILPELLRAGAGSNPQVFVQFAREIRPDISSFSELVADWAVANLVNNANVGDGRYAYDGLPTQARPLGIMGSSVLATVNQMGVDYLDVGNGPRLVEFDGDDAVPLTGARPKRGDWMWWSGRGDAQVTSVSRAFDLRGVAQAALHFSVWYELERHFDYAYVTVSVNGGETWQTLSGQVTNREDPHGNNLGEGLTGVSGYPGINPEQGRRGRWVQERMDLTPYTGQQILLRFWVVNDPSYNAQGLLLDEIHIPEIGYYDGGETDDVGWQSQGFVRTTGGIPQEWVVRLVVETESGIEVRRVELDERKWARLDLAASERGVLVVMGASALTDEPARYLIVTQ